MKQTVAVFDFDGTLSNGECGPRFFRFVLGNMHYLLFAVLNAFWLILYVSKFADEYALNKILTSIFKGRKKDEISQLAHIFSKKIMPHYMALSSAKCNSELNPNKS